MPASAATPALEDGNRMPGARWFLDARLNYAENLLRGPDDEPAIVFRNERGHRRELSWQALRARSRRASPPDCARDGVGSRRRRRRLPAEPARDRDRDARDDEPRRDLVLLLARLRRAGRARSLRPDHAEGAVRRRRLPLRGQDVDCLRRSLACCAEDPSSRSASCSCRTSARTGERRSAAGMRCLSPTSASAARRSRSSTCRSIIRSSFCIRPARPACRSASCTAPAARCCSS